MQSCKKPRAQRHGAFWCALVGLGLRKLSMNAASLACVKQALAGMTLAELRQLAARVAACADAEQVKQVLQKTGRPAGNG